MIRTLKHSCTTYESASVLFIYFLIGLFGWKICTFVSIVPRKTPTKKKQKNIRH